MEKEKVALSDLDKLYTADKELADLYIGQNSKGEDIIFKVAQAGNPLHEKMQRKYAKRIEKYRRFPDKLNEIYEEIVGISILKDLGKLRDDNGKIVPSTTANRIMVLHKYKQIFISVLDIANDVNNFIDNPEDEALEDLNVETTGKEDTRKN